MSTFETYQVGDTSNLTEGETGDSRQDIEDCVELVTETVTQLILVAYATKNKNDPILPTVFLIIDVRLALS